MGLGTRPTSRAPSAAVILALLLPIGAAAISPSVELGRLLHDSWTGANSVDLGSVNAIRQGTDGYLWISSDTGLHRFDGLRFSDPPLRAGQEMPSGRAIDTLSRADGSLWVSFGLSLIRLRDGRLDFREDTDRHTGVRTMLDAGGGTVWLLGGTLSRLEPGRPRRFFTADDGLPPVRVEAIALAGPGALWLGIPGAVCRWTPGSRANCHPLPGIFLSLFPIGPDDVYGASTACLAHIAHGAVEILTREVSELAVSARSLIVDRSGSVWVGTASGLLRIRKGVVERFTRRDGLSGDRVQTIIEDTEGDLWVGTNSGIDRFRDPRVLHLDAMDGNFSTAVAAAPDGTVWIGTIGAGLARWKSGSLSWFSVANGLPGNFVQALAVDRQGVLWLATDRGLARFERDRLVPALPDGPGSKAVFSIDFDTSGGAWFADQMKGAWRLFDRRVSLIPGLPQTSLFRLAGTPDGSMWLGYYENGVFRWRNGAVEPVDLNATGAVSAPRALLAGRDGAVWIGAGRVLCRILGGRLTAWGPRQGMPPEDIQSIAEDSAGVLWVATPEAVLRIARPDPAGGQSMLRVTRYFHQDGLRRRSSVGMYGSRIAVAPDGRIWVTEQDGVAILDPALLRPDTVPPAIHIDQIIVDGTPLPWGVSAFRGHEARIEYNGISLRAPERLHFKYRLDPGSQAWTDVQNQRSVSLISPEPGSHTFRLMACNLDEVCNEQGGDIEFQVIPYFSQTIWYKLMWLAFAAGIGYVLHWLNVQRIKSRFRLAAQERARVTREIHDTLLQGFAGVVYQLDAASRQFETHPAASKERLDKAIGQADNALTEARRTLQDMRLPVLEDSTLPEALQDVGASAVESGAVFVLRVKGTVVSLPYAAQAAMFLIGREAIHNAAKHSGAGRITVHLHYRDPEFRMTIADDGSGFDPAEAKKKAGHFGIDSMAVRARQAGAEFQVDTAPGKGTTVTVTAKRA